MTADILIKPLEDETLYSLVGRLSRLNGYKSDLTCQLLLGSYDDRKVADSEVSINKFIEATTLLYGDVWTILQRFTNYNFRNAISTPLLHGENFNKWYKSIANAKISLVTLSNFEEHRWKWCPKCMGIDLDVMGFTYWRIKHQLPGVFVCSIHFTLLKEVIIPFRNRQKGFFFPNSIVSGTEIFDSSTKTIDLCLARSLCKISEEIQNFNNIDQWQFRETIKSGFINNGMINKAGVIQPSACYEFGKYYYGLNGITETQVMAKSKIFNKNVTSVLLGTEINLTRPLIVPMLILWLYRDWQAFKNTYEWGLVMRTDIQVNYYEKYKLNSIDKNLHRGNCKLFIRSYPECKRKDFWKYNPKSCKWLKSNDTNWFKKIFPPTIRTKTRQLNLF